MWKMLNLDRAYELLAQCSCGGGSERRISYWAVLIPAAVVVLGGFLYDVYARRRSRMIDSQESTDSSPDQPNPGP